MTDPQKYTLIPPWGGTVTVTGAARRDSLIKRGYRLADPEPKASKRKKAE